MRSVAASNRTRRDPPEIHTDPKHDPKEKRTEAHARPTLGSRAEVLDDLLGPDGLADPLRSANHRREL